MKKIALCFFIIVVSSAATSCKKKKTPEVVEDPIVNTEMQNGLPEDHKSMNGYLYAGYSLQLFNTSYFGFYYSSFNDPAKNLLNGYNHTQDNFSFNNVAKQGNIDVGAVEFNSFTTLNKNVFSSTVTYQGNNSMGAITIPTSASWKIEGNGAFKEFDVTVSRGFPYIAQTFTPAPISKGAGYNFTISPSIANYDSLVVLIGDGNSSQPKVRKGVVAGANVISFSPAELSTLYISSYGALYVYAYNYSHQTINSKRYLFELSHKVAKTVAITN
jgi:hypothetical protein